MTKRPCVISIEGNIGSGKTTLIGRLEELWGADKHYVFLSEPIDVWTQIQDRETSENVLQKMYKYPTKYALSFQVMAYITFHRRLVEAFENCDANTVIICERSMESSRHIFGKMMRDSGNIDDINYQILTMFYEQLELIPVDAVIYLDTEITTNVERIAKRGRAGEQGITPNYLEKCRDFHEAWLHTMSFELNKPVLRLKTSLSEDVMVTEIYRFIEVWRSQEVGECASCNVSNMLYSNDKYFVLMKGADRKLLCDPCFTVSWREFYKDGWDWEDDILYNGEEFETESIS
jgi:deoxyadenosine/deoxycytidine kinase